MNMLSRTATAQILLNPDAHSALRRHWSNLIRSPRRHELMAKHHLLYLILLGKDWRRAFTCPTNRRKIENGAFWGWILFRSLMGLHMPSCEAGLLAPFDGLVTSAMLQRIRRIVAVQNAYAYRPELFAEGHFPFDAYEALEGNVVDKQEGDINV